MTHLGTKLGGKRQLEKDISAITEIDPDVLDDHKSLYTKSIARRMSWASSRETTKVEDIAYCLMGIFNVNCHFYMVKAKELSSDYKRRSCDRVMIIACLHGTTTFPMPSLGLIPRWTIDHC